MSDSRNTNKESSPMTAVPITNNISFGNIIIYGNNANVGNGSISSSRSPSPNIADAHLSKPNV